MDATRKQPETDRVLPQWVHDVGEHEGPNTGWLLAAVPPIFSLIAHAREPEPPGVGVGLGAGGGFQPRFNPFRIRQ